VLFGTEASGARRRLNRTPEAITGSSAFYKCYASARLWAPDVQPYRVESQPTTDSKGRDGKAGEWRAGFASPSLHTTRPYTWANGDISHSVEDSYSPTNSSPDFQRPVSQSGYGQGLCRRPAARRRQTAGEGTRHSRSLCAGVGPAESLLLWHVIYGTDRDTAKLQVAVNASSGDFWRVEK